MRLQEMVEDMQLSQDVLLVAAAALVEKEQKPSLLEVYAS
jgi:hypothetical protein